MPYALKGNAGFRYTPTGGQETTLPLRAPLYEIRPHKHRLRFREESADGTTVNVVTIGSGVYEITARMRFQGDAQALLEFLDAAEDGVTLSYYPDLDIAESYPCVLMSRSAVDPDPDRWAFAEYTVTLTLRRVDGGTWEPVISGVLWQYRPGRSLAQVTFSRNSTAYQVAADGTLESVAADVLRDAYYVGGVRATLLEGARTNGFTAPTDLSNAAWTKVRASTPGTSVTAPDGGTAYKLVEDTSTDTHYAFQNYTLASAGYFAASCMVQPDGRERIRIVLRDQATTMSARALFTLSGAGTASAITTTGGATAGHAWIERVGDWWWCWVSAQMGSETAVRVDYELDDGTTDTYTGDGSSGAYFWGMQVEPGIVASSFTTGARVADAFYTAYAYPPQTQTVYVKFRERGTVLLTSSARVIEFGDGNDPRLLIGQVGGDGLYRAILRDAAGNQVATALAAAPDYGDEVELRVVLTDEGTDDAGRRLAAVQIHQSIGGAAETSASKSGTIVLPDAWSAERLTLNSDGSLVFNTGQNAFLAAGVARGERSLAECRSLFPET